MKFTSFKTPAGNVLIRSFYDADGCDVRKMFRAGMAASTGSMYKDNFRNASFWMVGVTTLTVSCLFQSALVFLLTLVALVGVPYLLSVKVMQSYVFSRLDGDLRDIRATYMDRPRNHMWVAEYGGKVIGSICVREDGRDRTRAEILTLSVAKEFRRMGVATELTDTAIEFAVKDKYREIYLETGLWMHSANALYRRKGFQLKKLQCVVNWIFFKTFLSHYTMCL